MDFLLPLVEVHDIRCPVRDLFRTTCTAPRRCSHDRPHGSAGGHRHRFGAIDQQFSIVIVVREDMSIGDVLSRDHCKAWSSDMELCRVASA